MKNQKKLTIRRPFKLRPRSEPAALELNTTNGFSADRDHQVLLPSTAQRVQQIQTSLASSIRAEFASVTERLNTSQKEHK